MAKMNKIFFCVFGLSVVVLGYGTMAVDAERRAKTIVTEFERKASQVAANLYKGAITPELGNFVLSPLSLTSCMMMLNAGAEGETEKEIQSLFKFGKDSELTIQNHVEVLNSLRTRTADEDSGVELVTSSKIYVNVNNTKLLPAYKTAVSSMSELDRFADPKNVVARMNEWVNDQTRGKISKIVENKDVTNATAIVFLNAVYFKAPWKTQFNTSETKKADFHINENETVQVDMMKLSAEFPYADLSEVKASAIFLPYKGNRMSMIIYLPWKRSTLSNLEEKLGSLIPSEIRNSASIRDVSFSLPKFNISSSLDLKDILTSLGVEKMFNRTAADFSKMSTSPEFHISKVRQQVFIEVNEEGTEAAVVTDIHGLSGVSLETPLNVNRPFIFQIFDEVTGTILLSGRITNPNPDGEEPLKPEQNKSASTSASKNVSNETNTVDCNHNRDEMLIDILDLLSSPNSTLRNELTARAPRLQIRLDRLDDDKEEARKIHQNLAQTVQKLQSRILALETKNQVQTTEASFNTRTRTARPTERTTRPTERTVIVPRAVAWMYTGESWSLYDSTVNGSCSNFGGPIVSVSPLDSCVLLHEDQNCNPIGKKKIRLDRKGINWYKRNAQNPFGREAQPQSIGVCV